MDINNELANDILEIRNQLNSALLMDAHPDEEPFTDKERLEMVSVIDDKFHKTLQKYDIE